MRVLLAWELGAGLGHVTALLAAARALRARGHDTVFALREGRFAGLLAGEGFEAVAAPALPASRQPAYRGYAELLLGEAFSSDAAALEAVRAWRALFAKHQPALLLANHAPAALLAARGVLPAAACGAPFSIPPPVAPMPRFTADVALAADFERALLARLNAVAKDVAAPPFQHASELYGSAAALVLSFPGLDCFGPRPAECYAGALETDAGDAVPDWPAGGETRFLLYMRAAPALHAMLEALATRRVSVIAHVPGLTAGDLALPPHIRLSEQPLRMSALLNQCDAVIGYGGNGLATHALAAGRPLLLLPRYVEQLLNASRVQALGAGLGFLPLTPAAELASHLDAFAPSGELRRAAERFAHSPEVRAASIGAQGVAARLEALVSGG